jgi:hypothetical protein
MLTQPPVAIDDESVPNKRQTEFTSGDSWWYSEQVKRGQNTVFIINKAREKLYLYLNVHILKVCSLCYTVTIF